MEESITINISSDIPTRKGAYADLALVDIENGIARLDFVSRDLPTQNRTEAVLTSRVYIPVAALVSLRESIDERLGSDGND